MIKNERIYVSSCVKICFSQKKVLPLHPKRIYESSYIYEERKMVKRWLIDTILQPIPILSKIWEFRKLSQNLCKMLRKDLSWIFSIAFDSQRVLLKNAVMLVLCFFLAKKLNQKMLNSQPISNQKEQHLLTINLSW